MDNYIFAKKHTEHAMPGWKSISRWARLLLIVFVSGCAQLPENTQVSASQPVERSDRVASGDETLGDCAQMFREAAGTLGLSCAQIDAPGGDQQDAVSLARWYQYRNQYFSVNSINDIDTLLAPGDVVFYSASGGKGSLLSPNDIAYAGIVLGVDRGLDNEVQSYQLLSYQSSDQNLTMVNNHSRNVTNDVALGNGHQHLIGIARMCKGRICRSDNSITLQASIDLEPIERTVVASVEPVQVKAPVKVTTSAVIAKAPEKPVVRKPRSSPRVVSKQEGKASWYGPGFHGKTTANGERYDMHAMTAAHKKLPFNSKVRVTRLDNGKSTVVRINDRGPYIRGRIIDLSKTAAKRLGLLHDGVAPVRIEVLR